MYRFRFLFLFLLIIIGLFWNCKKTEKIKRPPGIQNFMVLKDTLRQNIISINDTLSISFTFINQNGDAGFRNSSDSIKVRYFDKRDNFEQPNFLISPNPPPWSIYRIEDEVITLILPTTCCIYNDGTQPCDPKSDFYQEVAYEFIFTTNFGQILENQQITFTVNCN